MGSISDVEDMIFLLYDMNSWLWASLSKESHLSQEFISQAERTYLMDR